MDILRGLRRRQVDVVSMTQAGYKSSGAQRLVCYSSADS